MKNFFIFNIILFLSFILNFLINIFRLHSFKHFWKFRILRKCFILLVILGLFDEIFNCCSTLDINSNIISFLFFQICVRFVVWERAKLWPKRIQIFVRLIKLNVKSIVQRWLYVKFLIFFWISFLLCWCNRWMSLNSTHWIEVFKIFVILAGSMKTH